MVPTVMSTPTVAPSKITQGLTAKWIIDPGDDYRPAAGWTCQYQFSRLSDFKAISASDNSDGRFLVTLPATGTGVSTDDFTVGDYSFRAVVSKTTEAHEIDRGTVTVAPAFTVAVEGRSFAKQMLDAIETKLLSLATTGQLAAGAISVKDRTISYRSEPELRALRDKYKAEYLSELEAERRSKGLPSGRTIYTRMD